MSAMLEIGELNAWYGDSHVLQGIDLSVAAKSRVAVVGRNGAGKTTLLKSIMNGGPRVRGVLRWDGQALQGLADFRRARLGLCLVPEDRRIFPHLTVIENLLLAQEAAGRKSSRGTRDPEELLRRFPMLADLRERPGGTLSGGQQQMLAVARGFAARPRMLLLDEPTEGLAPVIIQQLAREVRESCAADDAGLLLCEQNLWFARQCTERVYVLDAGRIVFGGDWSELDGNPQIKQRYLAV
jgi:ABC-type branched-subunit amino acid transport system ATPase component